MRKVISKNITASFGIAKIVTNIPLYSNIARADEALYAAKRGGRNQAIAYEELGRTRKMVEGK